MTEVTPALDWRVQYPPPGEPWAHRGEPFLALARPTARADPLQTATASQAEIGDL